jgi:hypothetical protein
MTTFRSAPGRDRLVPASRVPTPHHHVVRQHPQLHHHLWGGTNRFLLRCVSPRPCLSPFIAVSTPPPRPS